MSAHLRRRPIQIGTRANLSAHLPLPAVQQLSKAPSTNFAFFKVAESEAEGKTVVHNFAAASGTKTVRETCASRGEMLLDRTEGSPQIIGIVPDRIQRPYEFQARCHVWIESKCADVTVPEGIKAFARHMQ